MSAQIKNLHDFIGHIRASQTIDDASANLDQFMDFYSKDYEEEFLDNYIGEAKRLLDEFSLQITKMAEEEIVERGNQK